MFGGVVLGVEAQSKEDHDPFEEIIDEAKKAKGVELDTDLDVDDLIKMVADFKAACKAQTGEEFPEGWNVLEFLSKNHFSILFQSILSYSFLIS